MKKNYVLTLLLTLFALCFSFGQSVLITGYVDATCSGAKPRTVEVYVNGTVDFTGWKLIRQTNGKGFAPGSGSRGEIDISGLGSLTNTFAYITNDSVGLASEFGITTNFIQNGNINSNGDDAFQLLNASDTVVDRYGVDMEDGTGKDWEHEDTYYYRKDGSTANSGNFNVSNWVIGVKNLLDNKGLCNGGSALSTFVPFGSFKATASTAPSLKIASPTDGTILSARTSASVLIGVTNFNVAAGGTGDGYIKWKINGVAQSDKFNVDDEVITVAPGNSYTIFMELVDNSGNTIMPNVMDTVMFSVELPCNLQLGTINTTCDALTNGTDGYSGTIAFDDGNTGVTYTITAPSGVTIGGDNPSTVSSGKITFTGMTEGTNAEIKIVGDATSSCNFTRTLISPICYPLPILETFSYTENQSLITNPLWQDASTSNPANDIQVIKNDDGNGNPILGNYYSAAQLPNPSGNFVRLDGKGSDPFIGFEGKKTGVVYASFLFHITNMDDFKTNTNGGYFAILAESNGTFKPRIWVKDPTAGAANEGLTFQLGISVNGTTSTVSYNRGFTANLAEPVFVVFSYDFSNQVVSLWTVPDANSFGTNTPPAKSASVTAVGNDVASDIGRFVLRQDSDSETPTIDFDELRIGTSWKDVTSNPTASVKNAAIDGFALYPNPVTNKNFTVKSLSTDSKKVVIFNVLGKKVFSSSFSGTKKDIDVSELNSGVYILKVTESGKTATKKLVIR